jgi:hypothetical protein
MVLIGMGLPLVTLGWWGLRPSSAVAQFGPRTKMANLRETLEKGLQARRPEEFEFIRRVVQQVDDGTLPMDLVRGTFDWARRKRPFPFPYFERALKLRAAKLGITVT